MSQHSSSDAAFAAATAHSHAHAASSAGAAQVAAASFAPSAAAPVAASAAAAPAPAVPRKQKRERKVADLTPALVAQHRSGWSRLLRVTDFVASYRRLRSALQPSLDLLNHPQHANAVDLSVSDLCVETPFAKIDRAISEEVAVALDYQARQKRARDEAKAQQTEQRRMEDLARIQLQQQQAVINASMAGSAAAQIRFAKMQMQIQQQQQQQQQQHQAPPHSAAAAASAAASASDPFAMEDPSHSSAPDHMQLDMPPILAERAAHGQDEDAQHSHNHAAAASASAAAAASSASAAAASSMDHSDDLQDTQPVLSSQASMMLSQQTDATIPVAAAAASASGFDAFPDDSLSAMVTAATSAHSAPLHSSATALVTPPNFGSRVPKYNDLMDPLKSLLADRAHALGKRGRLETNCVTARSMEHEKRRNTANAPVVPLDPDEVLLRVSVYHPTLHSKMQEFLVCGSQPLTDLKDRIYCLNDLALDGPSTPSACFFIEGCFYDDGRHARAIRLSDTIVEWVRAEGRYTQATLGHFDQKRMESTRFDALSLRLGAHYLYQHQGDCAHTIVFTQMRMAHATHDEQNKSAYPLKVFQGKTQRQPCGVCRVFSARYVTYGDKMADASPFFWCDACYRPMHYSREGELLYSDFKVFEYEHD